MDYYLNNVIFSIVLTFSISLNILFLIQSAVDRFFGGRKQLPPCPRGFPIIGNLVGMLKNRPTSKWIVRVMNDMKTDIACFRFGRVHVIAITSDIIAREVVREKDAVFADRPDSYSAEYISGGYNGVVFDEYGERQKKMKKVMSSELMSTKALNLLLKVRNLESDNLLAYVLNLYNKSESKTRNGVVVNVREIVCTHTHNVKMRLLFGRRNLKEATIDGSLGLIEKEHFDAIFKALDCFFSFYIADYYPFFRGWNLQGEETELREAVDVIANYNKMIIDEKIELWRGENKNCDNAKIKDWLDILFTLKDANGNPLLTPQEITHLSVDLDVVGIDNSVNVIEWTLAEMLNQREILDKAVEEIDMVVGKDRLVQESDVPNLNYVKACCRETFRLHPTNPFLVPHMARHDTTLAGYFIPKGSHILVSRPGVGRNPKTWDEPLIYRPERHITGKEVMLTEPDLRLVSFGTGRRGCVGAKLGTSMIVTLLGRLLQGFDWTIPPGTTDKIELVESKENLFMANPLMACVKPRLDAVMYPKLRTGPV
ncbi:PREDICTED: dihomomethionine N-hydroxylase [Camelina sativa]|uniref:Dihomomethionine N-hydroxylase n=1 Tax=Camelina sativa TaxID=90675 RepID=A0ABM0WQ11_CAMSA|nr:PREDICTED: dihomomethionine N-hydroxylase [Camelina sativa]